MLANWIRQTVDSAPGTATIDLSTAQTGFVEIADQFNTGDNVNYFVEDGDNREEGRGVFTAGAPDTLTRGEVVAKLDTGVLSQYPGTGLTLSADAIVTVNASAAQQMNGGTQFVYTAARDYDLPDNFSEYDRTTTTTTADELYLYPAVFLFRRRINNFHISITTADAGSTDTRIGVWDQQVDGNPGNLIFDSGAIDVSATGIKTISTGSEIAFNPGAYWFGFISDSATVQGKGFTMSDALITGGFGGVDSINQFRRRVGSIQSPTTPFTSNLTVTVGSADHVIGAFFS